MKRAQIKELAESIAYYEELSDKDLSWIINNFSRQEKKLFMRLLAEAVKERNVTATFAGAISDSDKKKIVSLFPDKKIEFKRDDDSLGAGVKLEYSDFVLDYSVSGIIKRILNGIRESL